MKKGIQSLFSVSLSTLLLTTGLAGAAQFSDTSGNWAQQAIDTLSNQGIIGGYPNGQFRPEAPITRAEFASILVKAERAGGNSGYGPKFNDVPANFWAAQAIGTAAGNNWVTGYPGGNFRPNQDITRAEAMAVLDRAAGINLPSPQEADQILSRYNDNQQVPQWARPVVAAAIRAGIYSSYPSPNSIRPLDNATRADIASMTQQTLAYQSNGGAQTAQQPYNNGNNGYQSNPNAIQARVSVVPAQTTFNGVLTQTISSAINHVGDPVTVTLNQALTSSTGQIVVPQGSQLNGTITTLSPAGRSIAPGKIGMLFTQVQLPDGRTLPASVRINTDDGLLVGGTTKGRVGGIAARTLGGAALGGAAGAILGDLLHGNKHGIAPGLATGAAIGGVGGAVTSVATKGQDVTLQSGDSIDLRLSQDLSTQSENRPNY